jgi:hypothetical protein
MFSTSGHLAGCRRRDDTRAAPAGPGGEARDPGGDAAQDRRARCQSGAAVLLGLAQQVGPAILGHLVHQVRVHRVLSELLSIRSEIDGAGLA